MEYDNDRLIKPAYTIEIFYWVLLILMHPLVNIVGFFTSQWQMWLVLPLVGLAVFPAYLLFSRLMGPFLLQQRYVFFALGSISFFFNHPNFSVCDLFSDSEIPRFAHWAAVFRL